MLCRHFFSTLEYSIRRVQVIQDGLKSNGSHQILVYANDVNILGGSVHHIKENAECLVVARKEIGLEVNADKTQNISSFERVEEFKYLGKTITNQNSIQEESRECLLSFGEEFYVFHIPIKQFDD
jgi:sorting nexin-29